MENKYIYWEANFKNYILFIWDEKVKDLFKRNLNCEFRKIICKTKPAWRGVNNPKIAGFLYNKEDNVMLKDKERIDILKKDFKKVDKPQYHIRIGLDSTIIKLNK